MARCVCPFENGHWADFYADAVACAAVPVYGYVGSVDSKLLGRFHRSPYVVFIVLVYDLAVLPEVSVDWQTIFTIR